MNVAALRRSLRRQLDALEPEAVLRPEPSSPRVGPSEREQAGTSAESAPECDARIPPAILFALERGLGWPRASEPHRLARPTEGPILPRRRS